MNQLHTAKVNDYKKIKSIASKNSLANPFHQNCATFSSFS